MILKEVVQGSEEWFQCRIGIPTSSCFNKLITPKGKISEAKSGGVYEGTNIPRFSQTAESYAHLLLAEIITGESLNNFPPSFWMERGSLLEGEAADLYEFLTGLKLNPGGFVTDDEGKYGSSPDRLVSRLEGKVIGGLEIKCPAPWTHVENLLKDTIDKDYISQVQGQMLCGDLEFVDWMSYHPEMPPKIIRTYRDEKYIAQLKEALDRFDQMMTLKKKQLAELGALKKVD